MGAGFPKLHLWKATSTAVLCLAERLKPNAPTSPRPKDRLRAVKMSQRRGWAASCKLPKVPPSRLLEMDPDTTLLVPAKTLRHVMGRLLASLVQAAGMRGQTLARVSQHWYSLLWSNKGGRACCSLARSPWPPLR